MSNKKKIAYGSGFLLILLAVLLYFNIISIVPWFSSGTQEPFFFGIGAGIDILILVGLLGASGTIIRGWALLDKE